MQSVRSANTFVGVASLKIVLATYLI